MISLLLILRTLASDAAPVRSHCGESDSGRTGLAVPSLKECCSGGSVERRSANDQALAAESISTTAASTEKAVNLWQQ
jgi:hypothetical protein